MEQKNWFVRTGDFFFKHRNAIFPIFLVSLFLTNPPPAEYFGSEELEDTVDSIACVIVFLGLGLRAAVIGFRYIKRGGLNKKVYAKHLVTDGFFAACRNPLYVGNFLIYAGVLMKHGSVTVMIVGLLFFTFVYSSIVAAEEFFLRKEFGAAYEEYCRDVPRWGLKLGRLRAATRGMKFNFARVLAKDYSTMANAFVTLILLELWEEMHNYPAHGEQVQWWLYGLGVTAIVVAALLIRAAKKRGILKGD